MISYENQTLFDEIFIKRFVSLFVFHENNFSRTMNKCWMFLMQKNVRIWKFFFIKILMQKKIIVRCFFDFKYNELTWFIENERAKNRESSSFMSDIIVRCCFRDNESRCKLYRFLIYDFLLFQSFLLDFWFFLFFKIWFDFVFFRTIDEFKITILKFFLFDRTFKFFFNFENYSKLFSFDRTIKIFLQNWFFFYWKNLFSYDDINVIHFVHHNEIVTNNLSNIHACICLIRKQNKRCFLYCENQRYFCVWIDVYTYVENIIQKMIVKKIIFELNHNVRFYSNNNSICNVRSIINLIARKSSTYVFFCY